MTNKVLKCLIFVSWCVAVPPSTDKCNFDHLLRPSSRLALLQVGNKVTVLIGQKPKAPLILLLERMKSHSIMCDGDNGSNTVRGSAQEHNAATCQVVILTRVVLVTWRRALLRTLEAPPPKQKEALEVGGSHNE